MMAVRVINSRPGIKELANACTKYTRPSGDLSGQRTFWANIYARCQLRSKIASQTAIRKVSAIGQAKTIIVATNIHQRRLRSRSSGHLILVTDVRIRNSSIAIRFFDLFSHDETCCNGLITISVFISAVVAKSRILRMSSIMCPNPIK